MRAQLTRLATGFLVLLPALGAWTAETDLARVRQAEETRVKLVAELARTVVAVFREPGRDAPGGGGGSGVLIGSDGTALTNYHVVGTSKKVFVGTSDGKLHQADVIGTDQTGDIAVLRLKDGPFQAARLGDSDKLEAGDSVLAMGNPFLLATDFAPTVSLGIVSGNHRYLPGAMDDSLIYTDCIQIDAAINPGNSGGPLFNFSGELVGINGRISGRNEARRVNMGVGFAVPINQIKLFLPDLIAGKKVHHGILGVEFDETADGIKVSRVLTDSAADKAGIKVGDHILDFQGRQVSSRFQLMNRIGLLPAGSAVSLKVERDGKPLTLEAALDARPVGGELAARVPEEPDEEPATPGQNDEDAAPTPQQIVKRYAEALGGYQRLDSLKTAVYDARVRLRLPTGVEIAGTQKIYQRGHYSTRIESSLRMGSNVLKMINTYNDRTGWRSTANGVEEIPADDFKEHLAEAKAFEQLESAGGWDKIQAQVLGLEKVGNEDCHVVKTTDDAGADCKWFFSVKSGFLLKYSHYSRANKSEADDYFEDYRDVGGGLKQPFRLYRMVGGVRVEMADIQNVEVNPELDNSLFDEPPKQIIGPKVY